MGATDVLVAGNGDVWVANAAEVAAAPGSATAPLDPAFQKLGLLTPDAVVWNPTITTRSYKPWGSLQPTKRRTTGRDGTVSFELLEFVEDVLLVALVGGGYIQTTATDAIYLPTIDNDPPMLYVVIDNVDEQGDGTRVKRLLFPAAQVVSSPEIPFTGERATTFPVTLACNAPATLFPYAILHGFIPRPPRPPRPNVFMRAYVLAGEGPPGSDADLLGHPGAVYIDIVSGDVYEGVSGFPNPPSTGRRYLRIVHGAPDDAFGEVGDSAWDIDSPDLTVYGKR
jgi:hypothetical protein